ncbi:signal peptidase I [Flagellimonas zhangzhouensis]|uniref:Signal peptidase I n=1 Tax=Flagellimonas zhangzhouensis TaxID=1073328 RepID=A0A1H2R5J4_9FLAO|nr:signal peptidase I [Allomuricauda zhangzhouensis]SDQ59937.1 signal peptidase I [Allomuricauda zhangzhouensis]SDW14667.1 signal peptidase I [Allomuricauda zhangzhouensis]
MDGTQWIIFILLIQVIHFLGTWKLYVKAGRKAWEAAIPVYNGIVLMKIINRPWWWVLLLFIPIINLLMFPVVWVETIRSFGKHSVVDTWLVILTLGFYTYYINYVEDVKYIEDRDLKPRTGLGEWVSSIVFAVVAATFVHTYFIQPYVIPTGSLERTLRVGDFLFVSKFHYGARVPMTTLAAPMVHDTLPVLHTKSYLADVNPETYKTSWINKLQLPYMRLPGFERVKKNDIVVFSLPADTLVQFFRADKPVKKPIDKKSNYVKRCVGTPGDSLSVINGDVYIDGEQLQLSDRAKPMFVYDIYSKNGVSSRYLEEVDASDYVRKYIATNINEAQYNALAAYVSGAKPTEDGKIELYTAEKGIPTNVIRQLRLSLSEEKPLNRMANLTDEMVESLRNNPEIDSVVRTIEPKGMYGTNIFPQKPNLYPWNNDNFGPIYIPEAGKTVEINAKTIPLYKKIIRDYEHNDVKITGDKVFINGQEANSYTFRQDYYWMMGDNRDHSEDSRTWGYVPADHIVGKPVFLWMSFDNFREGISNWRVRWNRVFTTVGGSGEPVSYFWYFIAVLAGWFIFDFFRKKKKQKAD